MKQLRALGAVPAYVRAKRADKSVSLNLLYGMVASLAGCHWRDVKRNRKLELLNAIETYEEHDSPRFADSEDELSELRNIGKAMRKDFAMLRITSVKQLARCDADFLYTKIQTLTATRHDPCVWDTYAAAIHQARTGEALPWWDFTKIRKDRESKGTWLTNSKRPGAK